MSSSSDPDNSEDISDPEDPLIEIPRLSGNELIRKSLITPMDIRGMVVKCTTCLSQINHHDSDKCRKHHRLNVLVCKECDDFYGTSEFSQDESGNYNYCTWCGNGGKLYLCDFCPNSFCSTCVRGNFGRAEVSRMSKEGWKCYMCDPSKLKAKVAYCELILNYSKNAKIKSKKKPLDILENSISKSLIWTESENWVLPAFNDINESCASLHKRLDKLKTIGSSESKSLRHVIKKMEEIVNSHRSELSLVMKTLSNRYIKFLEDKKRADKTKNEVNGNADKSAKFELNGKPTKETVTIDLEDDKNVSEGEKNVSEGEKNVPEDEKNVSKDENILDKNYKAKMSLLNDDAFLSSTSDTESKDGLENAISSFLNSKESDAVGSESDNKESKKDCLKTKTELKSEEEPAKKVGDNIHSEENVDPLGSDENNLESQELFLDDVLVENAESSTKEESKANKTHSSSHGAVKKKTSKFSRKLNFDSAGNATNSSISDSDVLSDSAKKKTRRKLTPKKDRPTARRQVKDRKPVGLDDPKLKLETKVVLKNCDHMLPDGDLTIPLPEEILLEDIDKEISSVCKSPIAKEKRKERKVSVNIKKSPGTKKHVIEISDASSSSICLSSSEDENKSSAKDKVPSKAKPKDDVNTMAKKGLLATDSEDSSKSDVSESPEEEEVKKKTKKGKKPKSDSSDDFQPLKKKKFDKLLHKRILSDDDDDSGNIKEKKEKSTERKKSKRKRVSSDDASNDKREKDSDSVHTSTSDSEEEREKQKKKRKRIKKAANSSSENEKEEGSEKTGSQSTPGKGRKNIKKILSKKDLANETKEAQNTEKERKKRVADRQKMYNIITDTSTDGKEIITRKMVLEVDPVSKEEVVEIHPELCEKLKPHQVKGVRFMWECTIESLKELEKGKGSGCILAHCMGLGKTLQVITFLHTCLTNEHVNKKIRTALVICPYNTVLNWSREFEFWLDKVDGDVLVHELTMAKDNYTRLDILRYWQRDGGVLIASYDIFRRLAADRKLAKMNKKNRDKIREYLVDPGPDIVVCDEGHVLKNEMSAVSKACSQLATERRIVLTGTPLQNNLKEYHCMLSFVKPHLLGTSKEFRNRFVNPIMNGQYDDSREYDVKRMKKRIHILHKLLDGCVQRCDYSALTKFLPPKHEFVISVKLSEVQIKMYRHYLDNLSRRKADQKLQGGTLFSDYNILRNLCTHPYIVHTSFERAEERRMYNNESEEEEDFINDESEESPKSSDSDSQAEEVIKTYKTRSRATDEEKDVEDVEKEDFPTEKRWYHEFISDEDKFRLDISGKMMLLIEILKECEAIGDKVILFSQSLLTLDIVEDILGNIDEEEVSEEDKKRDILCRWVKGLDYFRMDGTTSADLRKRFIDNFNNPLNDRARLFLVSTKAGGLGTNLVGANRVVMLDASWNPSHDVQAIFRVYRFGQTKPVYIYRLLAQGTMEEKIYDRQVTKLSLSIRVVDEQQIDRHFNAADLAELYNFTPDAKPDRPTPMVPKDTLLAEMLIKHSEWIVTYHEHDSLLQNETEEDLTEEERQAAWNEYENEREGRNFDNNLGEEIGEYSREPDFAQADYVGTMIPNSRVIIENIIAHLKRKFPNFSAVDLRRQLSMSICTLISMYQEKHVRVLRMKQEYVAKGSVPVAVNKFLDELNKVLTDLNQHSENIKKMVQNDHNAQVQARMAQMQQQKQWFDQVNARFTQQRPTFVQQPHFAGASMPQGAANFPPFMRMRQNVQARMQTFPGGMNAGLSNNFRAGDQRWTTAGNINTGMPFAAHAHGSAKANTIHSQPVITEVVDVDKEESNLPQYSKQKSSVVIEEID